jgi:hypothetical protein
LVVDLPLRPLVVFSALQLLLILITPKVYDRYFLFLTPGAFALAAPRQNGGRWRWPAAGVLLLYAALSLAMMHDWLSWNSARWALGRRALERRVHPWDVEGGFEWNGWYGPGPGSPTPPEVDIPSPTKTLRLPANYDFHFWHVTGRFAITFQPPEDAKLIDSQAYSRWLPPGRGQLFLVEYAPTKSPAPGD